MGIVPLLSDFAGNQPTIVTIIHVYYRESQASADSLFYCRETARAGLTPTSQFAGFLVRIKWQNPEF